MVSTAVAALNAIPSNVHPEHSTFRSRPKSQDFELDAPAAWYRLEDTRPLQRNDHPTQQPLPNRFLPLKKSQPLSPYLVDPLLYPTIPPCGYVSHKWINGDDFTYTHTTTTPTGATHASRWTVDDNVYFWDRLTYELQDEWTDSFATSAPFVSLKSESQDVRLPPSGKGPEEKAGKPTHRTVEEKEQDDGDKHENLIFPISWNSQTYSGLGPSEEIALVQAGKAEYEELDVLSPRGAKVTLKSKEPLDTKKSSIQTIRRVGQAITLPPIRLALSTDKYGPLIAVADTGASDNAVSHEFVKKHQCKVYSSKRKRKCLVVGDIYTLDKFVRLNVTAPNGKKHYWDFYVLPIPWDMLLGRYYLDG